MIPFLMAIPSAHLYFVGLFINLKPGDVEGWIYYADLLIRNNKLSEAKYALEQAIALDPNNAEPWMKLGNVYDKMNLPDKAADAYNQAGLE
jgi:cytochrome c-type biogenesis protein CcmH/NrfG